MSAEGCEGVCRDVYSGSNKDTKYNGIQCTPHNLSLRSYRQEEVHACMCRGSLLVVQAAEGREAEGRERGSTQGNRDKRGENWIGSKEFVLACLDT